MGCFSNGRVLWATRERKSKRTYTKSPGTREWASLLECVSTDGRDIIPLVIFKGKSLQTAWFSMDTPSCHYTTSENGWTSNNIGLKWLEMKFLPETKPTDPQEWRLLICDGHGSHTTVEFMKIAKDNRVFIIYLPSHTSHVLQPLDLGVFGPLKQKYSQQLQKLAAFTDGTDIKKNMFLDLYKKARIEGITSSNIKISFRTTDV
ncbi:CENP-B protein [Aulographum hederae CBS 113979]|uniref:CENP-B protein n=1 Tax=Aulographum hederae CBS 113979 TaxID=1176131 RepID=A0A6G1GPZ1_9PEZI|nr:CENP-B protein [Aulographum hederae CBS 113979]